MRRRLRDLAPAALLAAALVACSLIGTRAQVALDDAAAATRDQPVDLLLTADGDPTTTLGGIRYLAPDAWMTAGLIPQTTVAAVRQIAGVDVVAPLTVLPMRDIDSGHYASGWVPAQAGAPLAWTADLSVTTTDGTGTRRAPDRQIGIVVNGDDLSVTSDVTAVSREVPGEVTRQLDDGRYRYATGEQAGYEVATYLGAGSSFAVAVDPQAEKSLATAAGAPEGLSTALDRLATLSREPDAGSPDAAVRNLSPPLTRGTHLPALIAQDVLAPLRVQARLTPREPYTVAPQDRDPEAGCTTFSFGLRCATLNGAGTHALYEAPALSTQDVDLSSSVGSWPINGYAYGPGAPVPVMAIGVRWDDPAPESRLVPVALSRLDAGGSTRPSVQVLPVGSPVSLGPDWVDETYRPQANRTSAVPALGPLVGDADVYTPTTGTFLPGTSPLEAASLRTQAGTVSQTLAGTGAATSAAPALVSHDLVQRAMGSTDLGASVLRVRLHRDASGTVDPSLLEKVSAQAARLGLTVTALTGASPVDVAVTLDGRAPSAWHGTATETWTELGAAVRVEQATRPAATLLPAVAVGSVALLALIVGADASVRRRAAAAVLLAAGWTLPAVRGRLLRQVAPGAGLVLLACVVAWLAPSTLAVSQSPARILALVGVGTAYAAGTLGLVTVDARHAARRRTTARRGDGRALAALTRRRDDGRHGLTGVGRELGGTSAVTGWRARASGRTTINLAALVLGALVATTLAVRDQAEASAGTSALAASSLTLMGAAVVALLVVSATAAVTMLVLGLREALRGVRARQDLLVLHGWPRPARLTTELSAWVRHHMTPLALAVVLLLAAQAPGPVRRWALLHASPAAMVAGALAVAGVLALAGAGALLTAARAHHRSRT